MRFNLRKVDFNNLVVESRRICQHLIISTEFGCIHLCERCNFFTACLAEILAGILVEWEDRACGTQFGSHVTDGSLAGGRDAVQSLAEVFEDGMRRNCPPEFCSRKKSGQSRKRLESQKDFREHQADVFAAAVALPADTLVPCATKMIRCMGFPDGVFVTGHKYDRNKKPGLDRLISNLADTCGVSRSAVKIRLQRLGLLQDRLEYGRDILIIL